MKWSLNKKQARLLKFSEYLFQEKLLKQHQEKLKDEKLINI